MRRSNDEFINEIFQRSEKRIVERNRRMKLAVSLVPAGLCVALLIMIGPMGYNLFPNDRIENVEGEMDNSDGSHEDTQENDQSVQDENEDMYPEDEESIMGEEDTDSEDGIMDEEDSTDSADTETNHTPMFRGMMILDIDGDTITLVDESGEEVVYIVTQEGIYDVSKEEYLKLSVEEEEFWKEILAIWEED